MFLQPLISIHLQLGTFRSHDGDYFIEPLLSIDEQEDEEEQNKPHIVYRRSTPQREATSEKRACDTPGICLHGEPSLGKWVDFHTSKICNPYTLLFIQFMDEVGTSLLCRCGSC